MKLNIDNESVKPQVRKQLDESVEKTLDVWISGVELALSEFDSVDHLPSRILLCGGGASLDRLVEALGADSWHTELPFTRKLSVHHIKPDDVIGITDESGKVTDHTFITAMGLLRVGYDTMIGSSDTGIKDKINKILRI